MSKNGFGRHVHYISSSSLQYFLAYAWGEWIQTFLTLMFTKVSICFFLLRLPASKAYIRPLWATIAALLISHVILTVLWILQCRPTKAAWNIDVEASCFSMHAVEDIILAQAILSIVSDFGLALYPILILHKVQMTFRSKVALSLLMGLGVITGSCAIVRTVIYKDSIADDQTYGGITNWFWRLFEVNLGIWCACIPAIYPGWKWLRRRIQNSRRSRRSSKESDSKKTILGLRFAAAPKARDEREAMGKPNPVAGTLISKTDRAMLGPGVEDLRSKKRDLEAQKDEDVKYYDVSSSGSTEAGSSSLITPVQAAYDPRGRQQLRSGDPKTASGSFLAPPTPSPPTVRTTDDPRASLEVDMRPNFESHRGTWRQMLSNVFESRRSSWLLSSLTSTDRDDK
ncbi:MAG: hypothetical protein M1831_002975 [Alyxoria varia]|nr:MAG: hypothetical protein M1831_002975 [Alyxoria varia]